MFKHFVTLQWKSFWRSASFTSGIVMKLFVGYFAICFAFLLVLGGVIAFKAVKKELNLDPLEIMNQFLVYWWVFDLIFRYVLQKMPVINIKPLLTLPFKKRKIVSYAFGKTIFSFFNILHAFFFIPFSIMLLKNGYPVVNVFAWNIGLIIGGVFALLGSLHYFGYFDITTYTAPFFQGFYDMPILVAIPILVLLILITLSFKSFTKDLYLDAGLASKAKKAKTENLDWLNRFGKTATFLKNDIKLLKRNKRARSTLIISVVFLFYGLLFFTDAKAFAMYSSAFMKVLGGIFVTGGFLFTFGQVVPSWDSSYYPLMMSQNIKYKEYLSSKWWLMVIATLISTILASGYLYFGWEAYLTIVVAAVYNIGVNSHIVLWGGAYVKTPIDLTSHKGAFGDKQAFNTKTLLLTLPKMVLPMVLYAIGHYSHSSYLGLTLVAIAGVVGFAFKDKVFDTIESIYKIEKYKTLKAYKQKN